VRTKAVLMLLGEPLAVNVRICDIKSLLILLPL